MMSWIYKLSSDEEGTTSVANMLDPAQATYLARRATHASKLGEPVSESHKLHGMKG